MKLVRFGAAGPEQPGLVDANGLIRSLSGHISDLSGPNDSVLKPPQFLKRGDAVELCIEGLGQRRQQVA
jgi:2-keto-4-pentenoate hydratase/2-oxohepta-3-ene-1,7-dioic acid hydratase in catechol pathway